MTSEQREIEDRDRLLALHRWLDSQEIPDKERGPFFMRAAAVEVVAAAQAGKPTELGQMILLMLFNKYIQQLKAK